MAPKLSIQLKGVTTALCLALGFGVVLIISSLSFRSSIPHVDIIVQGHSATEADQDEDHIERLLRLLALEKESERDDHAKNKVEVEFWKLKPESREKYLIHATKDSWRASLIRAAINRKNDRSYRMMEKALWTVLNGPEVNEKAFQDTWDALPQIDAREAFISGLNVMESEKASPFWISVCHRLFALYHPYHRVIVEERARKSELDWFKMLLNHLLKGERESALAVAAREQAKLRPDVRGRTILQMNVTSRLARYLALSKSEEASEWKVFLWIIEHHPTGGAEDFVLSQAVAYLLTANSDIAEAHRIAIFRSATNRELALRVLPVVSQFGKSGWTSSLKEGLAALDEDTVLETIYRDAILACERK